MFDLHSSYQIGSNISKIELDINFFFPNKKGQKKKKLSDKAKLKRTGHYYAAFASDRSNTKEMYENVPIGSKHQKDNP